MSHNQVLNSAWMESRICLDFELVRFRLVSRRANRGFSLFFFSLILRLGMVRIDNRRRQWHQRQLDPHRWFLCCTCSTYPRTWASSPRVRLSDNRTEICEWRMNRLCGRSHHSQAWDNWHLRISLPSPQQPLLCAARSCHRTLALASCSCWRWGSRKRCNRSLWLQLDSR